MFNGPLDIKVGGLAAKAAGVPRRVYRRGLALPIRDRWLNRYLFDHVLTHLIANSEATRDMLLRDIRTRFRRSDVTVIPNGLDLHAFDRRPFRPIFQRAEGQVVLGNVGRLTTQKGHDILLEVAGVLRRRGVAFRLLVAGEGALERDLLDRARELGVHSHVEFLGFVDDVPGFLASIDIFLLGSLWEGFGYVIIEAGAASVPLVAFDVSSNPEAIEHGTTGYLVPVGDASAFAARVQELIESPDLRRSMGAAARAAVERRFQLERTVDRLERLLSE